MSSKPSEGRIAFDRLLEFGELAEGRSHEGCAPLMAVPTQVLADGMIFAKELLRAHEELRQKIVAIGSVVENYRESSSAVSTRIREILGRGDE